MKVVKSVIDYSGNTARQECKVLDKNGNIKKVISADKQREIIEHPKDAKELFQYTMDTISLARWLNKEMDEKYGSYNVYNPLYKKGRYYGM